MKKIEKYVERLFHDITRNLKSYEQSRDAECLHHIRVDVKKLKAVINLIKENKKSFKAHKQFKPLRDIFREAGDIRQPEVLFQLLLKYGVNDIKKDSFLDTETNVVDDFLHHIPIFNKSCKTSKKELIKQVAEIDHKIVVQAIENLEKRLRKALTKKIKFELIHKTRKLVKQVIYLSDIHGDLKKKRRQFFDELQELIGAIHDKQMLMILLRKPASIDHQKTLEELKGALEADKTSIIERCQAFYKVENIQFGV